jgi:vacuolar-type H+-ATPase subunit H
MSPGPKSGHEERSTEERAEEIMQRVTGQATRLIGRAMGRAREELEDLVAEARTLNEHADGPGRSKSGRTRSAS